MLMDQPINNKYGAIEILENEQIEEYKIKYTIHNELLHGFMEEPVRPEGWMTEEEVLDRTEMGEEALDRMIRNHSFKPGLNKPRYPVYISEKWVELYMMDKELATKFRFKRFLLSPRADYRRYNYDMNLLYTEGDKVPSSKQLRFLKDLLVNQYLSASESWLIELITADSQVTKIELGKLLDYLVGTSHWDGFKWQSQYPGVLSQRKRAAKIYPAEAF
jgi:hypothetical protein